MSPRMIRGWTKGKEIPWFACDRRLQMVTNIWQHWQLHHIRQCGCRSIWYQDFFSAYWFWTGIYNSFEFVRRTWTLLFVFYRTNLWGILSTRTFLNSACDWQFISCNIRRNSEQTPWFAQWSVFLSGGKARRKVEREIARVCWSMLTECYLTSLDFMKTKRKTPMLPSTFSHLLYTERHCCAWVMGYVCLL